MAKTLAFLRIKIGGDADGLQKALSQAERSVRKTSQSLTKLGKDLSAYVTVPLLGIGAASIKAASDLQESINKVDVVFQDVSDQVKAFADTSLKSFGIARGTALDMASTFGDMATSMGLSTEQAAQMSTTLVGLAGDLASFKNIGIDQAQTALAGIFTGETESLKQLGIVMTQANLQAFALSKGIDANVQSMTEAQKVSLRYAYILDKTKNAQGDFARTGGGAANQMRIFQETLKELGETFGQQLLPAFTDILKHVNSLLQQFGALDDQTKKIIVVTAGLAAAAGPVVTIFGKLLPLLAQTAVYFKGIGSGAVSSTNWIVALSVAVASLERGLAKLVSNQRDKGGIIGFFQKMALSAFGTSEEIGKFVANTVTMQGQLSRGGGFAQMIGYQTKTREATDQSTTSTNEFENALKSLQTELTGTGKKVEELGRPYLRLDQTLSRLISRAGSLPSTLSTPTLPGSVTSQQDTPLQVSGISQSEEAFSKLINAQKLSNAELLKTRDNAGQAYQAVTQLGNVATQLFGDKIGQIADVFGAAFQGITQIFGASIETQKQKLEERYARERQLIEESGRTEEQKQAAIVKLDEATNKKRRELQRKQAKLDKAKALFDAIINVASQVASVVANPVAAAIVGALGAIQIGIIASQPIPALADGGILYGPSTVLAGEYPGAQSNPEIIAPLDRLEEIINKNPALVQVVGRISGNDILLINERAQNNRQRKAGF